MRPRYCEIIRVSTQAQADRDTPELQRRALDLLRRTRPGILVERIEVAISGATPIAERSDIKRLTELRGKYDELRIYAIDRLTRSPSLRERVEVFSRVADAGAILVDASGQVFNPAEDIGEISYLLQSTFAKRERLRIAQRSRDGCARKASEGKLPRGKPPFARTFDATTGTWGIDKERARVYGRIFSMAAQGKSIRQICYALEDEGVKAARSKRWQPSVVCHLIRDRSAIGEWQACGYPISVPAVTDRKTFERANQRLTDNRDRKGPKSKIPALLRKILTCGICGKTLYVVRGNSTAKHRYYQCASARERTHDPRCQKSHPVPAVDAAVKSQVLAMLGNRKALTAAAKGGNANEYKAELQDAERALARIAQQEKALARLYRKKLLPEHALETQAQEVARDRREATVRRDQAAQLLASTQASHALQADQEQRIRQVLSSIANTPDSEWSEVISSIFPRTPGYWLRIYPDGRIEGRGALSLDSEGAEDIAQAEPKTSVSGCRTEQIGTLPLRIDLVSGVIPYRSRRAR